MLLLLVGVYGVYKIIALIMLLVTGSVANVATSGDITVPTNITATITTTTQSISTGYGLINAGDAVILGLIGLVVILKLFGPLISGYMGGKKKKSGNMNY